MISHFVNRRAGFTCVIIAGCPQLNDYRAAAEVILANAFHDDDAAWMCDLLQSDFGSATNLQLLKLATFLDEVNPTRRKVALISAKPFAKTISKFALDHGLPDWGTFHEEVDAYRWITTGQLPDQAVPRLNFGSASSSSAT